MSDYAKGIKRKDFPGNDAKLKPGMLIDYFIQHHLAKRRGPHYDLRLGTKNTNLFSWATQNHPLKQHEGNRIPAARTNLHRYSYGTFEGHIPPGYGHGDVKLDSKGKAVVTRRTDNTISFSIEDGKYPQRFTLINPGQEYGKNYWILLKQKTPKLPNFEKTKYKLVNADQLPSLDLSKFVAQPKIDGALQLVVFGKHNLEMLSHRRSTTGKESIIHTERFFGHRPKINIPKNLRNSVFLAEVYGEKDGKPIPQQETSALLNSSLSKSLSAQREKNIKLKAMLFGVAEHNKNKLTFDVPYDERKKLLEQALQALPADKFHTPEEITGKKDIIALWQAIKNGKHNSTKEGLILHPTKGVPLKVKNTNEHDVYIRQFFSGKGKAKDIAGFEYSDSPNGKLLGRVGSGINEALRKAIADDPGSFIGRIARIKAQEKLPSGALRAPSLINLHEG